MEKAKWIPLEFSSYGSIVVFVTVNEKHRGKFLIDTGATGSVITPKFRKKCGLTPEKKTGKLAGVDSDFKKVKIYRADISFGDCLADETLLSEIDLLKFDDTFDGVLGLDVLSGWGKILIDFERRAFRLG